MIPATPRSIADEDPEPTPTFPLSATFRTDPNADVIIRTEGAVDFRVHKCILSLVSPVFKDMFTIPQPPTGTPGVLPHVDVQDPPGAWENILRTIYPMPNPTIDNLDELETLLLTAKKYEIQFVIDSHKQRFEDRAFIRDDPLRLYAIACAGGFEEQAKYVARHAKHQTVVRRAGIGDMKGLTLDSYHRLIVFLMERDDEWNRIIANATIPNITSCTCPRRNFVYKSIKQNLPTPYLRADEIYFRALEDNSEGCKTDQLNCMVSKLRINNFVDSVDKAKDAACDKFMW